MATCLGGWKSLFVVLHLFLRGPSVQSANSFVGEVKVGILHSQTGTMAISEQTVINAELMAIDEINEAGGLLGMEIVPVVEDGASDWDVFAAKAENFTNPNSPNYVKVVFGCWTSASRKAVKPVFEEHNHMLFYPVQYEGQECSNNIFYTGATPNQQIEPAVDWLLRYKGQEFFLVGSDYVFPRTANEIIKGQLASLGGTTVGEMYLPLGESGNDTVGAIVEAIQEALPSGGVIFNTLNGDSNVKFFRMLYDAGLDADRYPSMSVSITETEIAAIGVKYLVGHYAAWNFFQSTMNSAQCAGGFDPSESRKFVEKYRSLYGSDSLVNDPMEAAYIGVYLWAQAVALAGTFDLEPVREAVIGQAYAAPEGEVVMQANHHISKFVRLGQVDSDGDFLLIYESTKSFFPEPWNFWVESTKGYACDWSNSSLGGFYEQDAIQVALVHALTGPSAAVEKTYVEAEMAAIKTLNRHGGVLGKVIIPTVYDTQSDDAVALEILRSIAKNGTQVVIFGTPPSDSDYEVAIAGATLETGSPLLFDPRRSFGGQCSGKVIHMGAVINQQLDYALSYFSKRSRSSGRSSMNVFLVVPQELEDIASVPVLTAHVEALGDVVVGASVVESDSEAVEAAAQMAASLGSAGTVVNLLKNSSLSLALFTAMKAQNLGSAYPVVSTDITEDDIELLGSLLANEYVAMPYFSAVESTQSSILLSVMQSFYGSDYQGTDAMEAAYSAVNFWAEAVQGSGTFASTLVLHEMWSTTFQAPTGPLTLGASNYVSRQSRLGTLNSQQSGFRIVSSASALDPDPFWLFPETLECDFMLSLRTVCASGQGLVNSAGTFLSNRTDAVSCEWCSAGLYSTALSDSEGTTRICSECPAGQSQSNLGETQCEACVAGRYMETSGASECSLCPVGSFQSSTGSLQCQVCPDKHVTLYQGARSFAECVCQAGTYSPLGGEEQCLPCPEGLACSSANSTEAALPAWGLADELQRASSSSSSSYPYPTVLAGYVTPEGHMLEPYRCEPAAWCPGGPPGTCSQNRDPKAVACASCLPGTYENMDGHCVECEAAGPALLIAGAVVAMVVLLVGLTVVVNKNVLVAQHATITVGITLGLACTTVQAMGTFGNLSVEWAEPLASILSANSVLTFDIKIFRTGCLDSDPVTRYVIRQLFTPVASILILIILVGKKRWVNPKLEYAVEAVNTIGSLLKALFMSVVLSAMLPFICYKHPGSMGKSVLDSPGILCFDSSDHTTMVSVGVSAFLLFVAPYFSLMVYATANYNRFVRESNMDNGRGLRMHRFLFFQFKPECYYYGILFLLRGLLVVLVPVFIQDNAPVQIACMAAIFLVFFAIQQNLQPWKVKSGNYADGATSMFMIMVLFCAAMSPGDSTLGALATIVVFCLGFVLVGAMAYGVFRRLKKREFFHSYISHHKGEASAQARFLQLSVNMYLVAAKTKGRQCFLAADHAFSLDETLDVVRGSIAQLVVLLTNSALRSVLCAAEVTIAHQMNVQAVPVKTSGFLSPTNLQLVQLGEYLSLEDAGLAQLDITTFHVSEAYRWLLRTARLELDMRLQGRKRYEVLAKQIVSPTLASGVLPEECVSTTAPSTDVLANQIVISSDSNDNEATACACILAAQLPLQSVGSGTCMLADYSVANSDIVRRILKEACCLVVVLTSGSLESNQMYQLKEATLKAGIKKIVPAHTSSFRFPSKGEIRRRLAKSFAADHTTLEGCVEHLLKRPSVFLSTGGSLAILTDQMEKIARQLRADSSSRMLSPTSSGFSDLEEDDEYDSPWHGQLPPFSENYQELQPFESQGQIQESKMSQNLTSLSMPAHFAWSLNEPQVAASEQAGSGNVNILATPEWTTFI